jgi:hypothetical protein
MNPQVTVRMLESEPTPPSPHKRDTCNRAAQSTSRFRFYFLPFHRSSAQHINNVAPLRLFVPKRCAQHTQAHPAQPLYPRCCVMSISRLMARRQVGLSPHVVRGQLRHEVSCFYVWDSKKQASQLGGVNRVHPNRLSARPLPILTTLVLSDIFGGNA